MVLMITFLFISQHNSELFHFSVAKLWVQLWNYLFDGVTVNGARSLLALRNGGKVQLWANGWANSNLNTPSGFFTLSVVFNSANSQLAINGTIVNNLNTGTYSLTNGIHIGTNYLTNADFLEGDIAEFIVVNGVASTSNRQKSKAIWPTNGASPLPWFRASLQIISTYKHRSLQ